MHQKVLKILPPESIQNPTTLSVSGSSVLIQALELRRLALSASWQVSPSSLLKVSILFSDGMEYSERLSYFSRYVPIWNAFCEVLQKSKASAWNAQQIRFLQCFRTP